MLGKPVPDFVLPSTAGTFELAAMRGRKVVLFFPKRNTPRCAGCGLLGASRERFGVMKEKTLHGKKVRGIERSTFVIEENGVLAREWRTVKVPGHLQEVLHFVKAL